MEFLLVPIILVFVIGFIYFGKYILIKFVVNKGEKTSSKKKNIVRIPFAFRTIMLICTLGFLAFSILALTVKGEEWQVGMFGSIIIALIWLIIFVAWTLWKIEFTEEGFTYRNFIGIKKSYKFKDLELREHPKGMKWYFYKNGKKILCVDCYKENENELMKAYYYSFYGIKKRKQAKRNATETEEKGG